MSEQVPPVEQPSPGEGPPSPAARLSSLQRAGGIVPPILTVIVAFFVGGLVVLATGHNPLTTYREIFAGTGLNWFFQVGSHEVGVPYSDATVWFPWNVNDIESVAAFNLQQTLLLWIPLVFTGLAVAFAFRCGMFNIGGLGQYIVGAMVAVWVGSSWVDMQPGLHVILAITLAALAGALWAGIAGFLKATVGAHEVITTIMLNWIAYWIGNFAFGQGGPLQNKVNESVPVSSDVAPGARLPVFWGDPLLQGLHIGFLLAIAALVVYWITLTRTTLGYEVRAVGFNPEAARYGGISVAKSYFLAMAIAGLFAGMGGALDILGWQFRLGQIDIQNLTLPFIGIAVALLGRNTAVGVALSALLFSALLNGTSTRNLDPEVFQPELAGNLTLMIQALVLLFIGADLLILGLWARAKRAGSRRPRVPTAEAPT
ncbi:MAG TPA: ABC transporter permease [Solirubrobacterales bacterium]|nr:ABC transporter permease [Solirubrobacterales bacterium]